MADRTNKAQIEVPLAVRDQLRAYEADLERLFGRKVFDWQLLTALLSGVPLWQAEAMIAAYRPRVDPGLLPSESN